VACNLLAIIVARGECWCHLAFAVFLISAAAFSHKPWLATVPFDLFEDFLHSIAVAGMGFAFSFDVLIGFLQRKRYEGINKVFDAVAVVAAISLPLICRLHSAIDVFACLPVVRKRSAARKCAGK